MLINVVGCFAMGLLKPVITDLLVVRRWVNPFIGTGILGGFTTFSHCIVDVVHLALAGRAGLALLYLVGTVLCAILAVSLGIFAAKSLIRAKR